MAKESKNIKAAELDSSNPPLKPPKRKKGKKLIIFLIILILFGGAGYLFRQPISSFLAKRLKSVPVVNQFLKETTDPFSSLSKEQLIKTLKTNEQEAKQLNETIANLQEQNKALEQKVTALKQYETKYTEFLAQKEAWDEKVAQPNSKMFLEQFEKMYPETMEKIYKELKTEAILTKEQKVFSNTVGQMDPSQAAKALETLISTDPELIKLVFEGMEHERKSLILSNMAPANAATTIKLLSPDIGASNE